MKKFLCFLFSCFVFHQAFAQDRQLKGKITDKKGEALIAVNLSLTNPTNEKDKYFAITDAKGVFIFKNLPNDKYLLKATYVGYETLTRSLSIPSTSLDLGTLRMSEKLSELKELEVKAHVEALRQNGDTLQYRADAYKTHPDATTEELVQKMPGITIENGTLKAHGDNVKEVLVDGKTFFGDDPMIAMRNLPAEIIDRIEVFDRLSDQSQFTGVDDGNTIKTLNIITRPNKQMGQFGKFYGGYGTDDRYSAGGNYNSFDKVTRLSVIGLTNNINQQNFSNQDLLGVMDSGGGQGSFGGNRGGGGGYGGGGQGGGNAANNFLVGQQNGVSTTNSLGINYSDSWGKKWTVRGSYFFNDATTINEKDLFRQLFLGQNSTQYYTESSQNTTHNFNNRANFRFEYTIDKNNSLLITPRLNIQNNSLVSTVEGNNTLLGQMLNSTSSTTNANRNGYTFSNDILYRHRFAKRGRTISFDLGTSLNNKVSTSNLNSLNQFFSKNNTRDSVNQQTHTTNSGYQYSGNIVYTEPVGKGLLQFNYNLTVANNNSLKETNKYNLLTRAYDIQDTLLSNKFSNNYLTQKVGTGYLLRNKKLMLNFGLAFQKADLMGQQLFPHTSLVDKSFENILPSMMFNYSFTTQSRLRIFYRTSTNAPSITQLQNVIDNSNPLFLSTGNPNLRPEYDHSFVARYTLTKPTKASSIVALINATYSQNSINNAITIADKNTLISNGVVLRQGSQLTMPVNMGGNWQLRSLFTYGLPISAVKSTMNFSTGFNYIEQTGLINTQLNTSNQYNFSQGVVWASNISTQLDFTFSYTINYSLVDNSIQPQLNTKYFTQNAGGKVNWLFGKGFLLQSDAVLSEYKGLSTAYDQHFFVWNASFGKKFLKNNSGELKVTAFDLLNQNNNISRTITNTYIEDDRSNVLHRYFLMTFTYTLRNFKKA